MNDALPGVTIYTDGGCRPNPGPGGWGAVLLYSGRDPLELSGGKKEATNNRMELIAAIEALGALEGPHRVEIYTDSTYVRQGITEWLAKVDRQRVEDRRQEKGQEPRSVGGAVESTRDP